MGVYAPLRGALFIAEFVRFGILVVALVVGRPFAGAGFGEFFPYAVYAAPNGLFLLMAYFLWIRLAEYKPYIALYMAGKTIGVVSMAGWLIFLVPSAEDMVLMQESAAALIGGVSIVAALDGLTLCGGAVLNAKLKRNPSQGER